MDGRIVAVDFGGYSFLPPSFFAFALRQGSLAHRIATMLNYPSSPSPNASAVESASCALAPFSSNDIGEQIFLVLAPRPLPEQRAHCSAQAFQNDCGLKVVAKCGAQAA